MLSKGPLYQSADKIVRFVCLSLVVHTPGGTPGQSAWNKPECEANDSFDSDIWKVWQ